MVGDFILFVGIFYDLYFFLWYVLSFMFLFMVFFKTGKRRHLCLLSEVLFKVLLKIEVSKLFLGRVNDKKLLKLSVWADNSSVIFLLKTVGLDVFVDKLANLCAGHASILLLTEESGEFVTDKGWLLETRKTV